MSYERYAKEISDRYLHHQEDAEELVKYLFKRIGQDLAAGGRISFYGFGSFKRVKRKPRRYRNIHTGEIEVHPAYKDVEFSPSKKLLEGL